MATQKLEHKLNKYTERHDYVLLPDMSFYGLLNKVCNDKANNPNDDYRIIITTQGVCNDVFYSEVRQGNIHNGKVRLSKGNQIVGFEMYDITIDENQHYDDIKATMETLNEKIDKEELKYIYTGLNHHSLAYAY